MGSNLFSCCSRFLRCYRNPMLTIAISSNKLTIVLLKDSQSFLDKEKKETVCPLKPAVSCVFLNISLYFGAISKNVNSGAGYFFFFFMLWCQRSKALGDLSFFIKSDGVLDCVNIFINNKPTVKK